MFLSIIIPAYNEEKAIGIAIEEVEKYFSAKNFDFEVIVIDDGSGDRTSEIVREKQNVYQNLQLLGNDTNQGKGFSVRRGALAARAEWILFLDADLSTAPEEFGKMETNFAQVDIIIGSRAVHGARITMHQPFLRELGGRVANKLIRLYLGLPYHDTQCGFKVFNQKTKVIFEEQKLSGWLFDAELLFLAKKHGFRVKEFPISWKNDPSTTVKSGDFLKTISELIAIRRLHS